MKEQDIKHRKSSVSPCDFFHISRKNLGSKAILKSSGGYSPSGVSFAPSIIHCLKGVPFYYATGPGSWDKRKKFVDEGNLWYVYTPVQKQQAIIPSVKMVDDVKRTKERRVPGQVPVELVGKIRVSADKNKWEYEWLRKEIECS